MTQKEQLDDATTKLTAAEQERDNFKTQLETETKAHTAAKEKATAVESERNDFKSRLETETKAHTAAKEKLTAEEAKDKTADAKAKEQLAAKGIAPAAKDNPANLDTPTSEEGAALWERYAKADATEQSKLRAKLGDKLDAAATAYDRAQKAA